MTYCIGYMKNVHKILIWEPEEKNPHEENWRKQVVEEMRDQQFRTITDILPEDPQTLQQVIQA